MKELIVYQGQGSAELTSYSAGAYLYRIGPGDLIGDDFIDINNNDRLNQIAEEIRDEYCQWIYNFHHLFVEHNLRCKDLSLFFLTDLSCNRAEFFETFNNVCNLLYLREKIDELSISSVRLIGFDSAFASAFQSLFSDFQIHLGKMHSARAGVLRRFFSDLRFIGISAIIRLFWSGSRTKWSYGQDKNRVFFSFFPQMFDSSGREEKFGSLISTNDQVAAFLLSDGMHQKPKLACYFRNVKRAKEHGFEIVDRFLRWGDFRECLIWVWKLWRWYPVVRNQIPKYRDIDMSGMIKIELRFSISRLIRLILLKGSVKRFLVDKKWATEIFYYPVEYPLGRMISWISSSVRSDIHRWGIQMSPVSTRRLEQFLAEGEASVESPFLSNAPIPDSILAEDERSAEIYRYAGYQDVTVMEKIFRYESQEHFTPSENANLVLIAPGLHDGEMMMKFLSNTILKRGDRDWILKPHPRGDTSYLEDSVGFKNLTISRDPIPQLLQQVSEVYVTYSSVGLEASKMGLKVNVINIPGQINTSPLLDSKFVKSDNSGSAFG